VTDDAVGDPDENSDDATAETGSPGDRGPEGILGAALDRVKMWVIAIGSVGGFLAAVGLVAWGLGFGRYLRALVLVIRHGWPLWLLLGIAGGLVFLLARKPRVGLGLVGLMLAGSIVSGVTPSSPPVGNLISELNASGYNEARDYVAATEVVDAERPGYDERVALRIGELSIRRSLSGIVGEISRPMRVDGEWCSVVAKKGTFWNSWSDSVVCIDDAGVVRQASFPPESVPAISGGWRRSNMGNAVTSAAGLQVSWSADDAYGAIVEVEGEEVPRLYVPLRAPSGFDFSISSMPAGVVVFGLDDDGRFGVVTDREIVPGEHPGPVAGLDSAVRIREQINALNGFLPYKRETRSADSLQPTFVTTDVTDGDQVPVDDEAQADPNAGNATEFVLYRDGVPYAVTPLTSFGGASTITAYLEVRLDTVRPGEALEATVYRLPTSRAANASTVNAIRVLYGQDLADDDEIYEVTPLEPGRSRVTIARGDQVRFTAIAATEVSSGRPVGEICVFNRTGRQVDCTNLDGDARPLGTLISRSTPTTGGQGAQEFTGDLRDVPTAALLAELERRLAEVDTEPDS
jgi:hypothetical protein